MTDLDNLKHHIRTEWAKLDHAIKAGAVISSIFFWFRHCVFSDNYDCSYCCWSVEQLHTNS